MGSVENLSCRGFDENSVNLLLLNAGGNPAMD